jgi:hypothetical protein
MLSGQLAAKSHNPDIGSGKILFYTTGGVYKGAANVGNLPDMVTFLPDGTGVISANEGDDREYDGWEEYAKASSLKKKSGFSAQLEADILAGKGTEKLRVLKDLGLTPDGIYDQLFLAGTRSFSIWDSYGNQVFDSGDAFETYLATHYPDNFNTRVDDTKDPEDIAALQADNIPYEMVGKKAYFWEGVDARSQKKGCEPEALAVAKIGSKMFAYIGLEKQGGFFTYDITHPKQPVMVDYYNDIDYKALPTKAGDLAPEGMKTFYQGKNSFLAVANELSGTITVFGLGNDGKAAAEILDYD